MPSLALNSIISLSSRGSQAARQQAGRTGSGCSISTATDDDSSLLKLPYEIIFGSPKERETERGETKHV